MGLLRTHRDKQKQLSESAGAVWSNPDNLVFTDELGGNLKHITVYKNYKQVVSALGVPDTRFHDLRHSYAVLSLQAGDDVKTVQQNLGHATSSFTLDVYGHVSERMKQESAARMQKVIDTFTTTS
jgi:integrase